MLRKKMAAQADKTKAPSEQMSSSSYADDKRALKGANRRIIVSETAAFSRLINQLFA
jgi:hypothetical protein